MKTIFAVCALILSAGAYFAWHSMRMPSTFGTFTGAPIVQVAELIEHPKDYLKRNITVEGKVSEQCQSMGCYFFIHAGKQSLRIDLQEVAMTAPMREGHQARVECQLVPFNEGYQLYASAVEFQ